MNNTQGYTSGGECGDIAALQNLSINDMPSLEILLIDELGAWARSAGNPGHRYDKNHGALVTSTLLNAAGRASTFQPARIPAESAEMVSAREKVVAGAHELAEADNGLTILITRLIPAAIGELERNAGEPAAQVRWLFYWSLLALGAGTHGSADVAGMGGLMAAFDAWDELMGYGLARPNVQQVKPDGGLISDHCPRCGSPAGTARCAACGAEIYPVDDENFPPVTWEEVRVFSFTFLFSFFINPFCVLQRAHSAARVSRSARVPRPRPAAGVPPSLRACTCLFILRCARTLYLRFPVIFCLVPQVCLNFSPAFCARSQSRSLPAR